MMEMIMNPTVSHLYPLDDPNQLKMWCKTDFNNAVNEIKLYRREKQLSDQVFHILLATLLSEYVGCLVEAEFETKIAKWSDRWLSHWAGY